MFYDRLRDLELTIEAVELDRYELDTSSDFTRVTTEISLMGTKRDGDSVVGKGEDVTYATDDHDALARSGLPDLTGTFTIDSFSDHLDDVDCFPGAPPERSVFRNYRRWGLESAALDLALRANGTDLGTALDRDLEPVRFVASTGLGDPPSLDRVSAIRSLVPGLRFKLDPTPAWDESVCRSLVDLDVVRILDYKGHYEGTEVENPGDPDLYRRLIEHFPEAVIEDPALTPETRPQFEDSAVRERVSWDAPIHGLDDVEELPWEPSWLNIKPSRFGSIESVLETIAFCLDRGIRLYGGGQFELGVGRGQIQLLASLYYSDGPNDVAPRLYNHPEIPETLPASPLDPPASPVGFRWD